MSQKILKLFEIVVPDIYQSIATRKCIARKTAADPEGGGNEMKKYISRNFPF